VESSAITSGNTEIPYRIRRSDRRTTVAVTVAPGEGVVLVAPTDATRRRLDRVVHQKAPWIVDRLRHVGQVEGKPTEKEFVSGETFLYLGRNYRLKVELRVNPKPTKLDRGWLRVQVSRQGDSDERGAMVRMALEAWYIGLAQARIPERVEALARKSGLRPGSVIVRNQSKRWGSCDRHGSLRFNWRVIQAPTRLVDYVVAHELAHLRYENHTKSYWALLGKVMPDYEARRAELRSLGTSLVW